VKTLYEVLRQTLELVVVKGTVGISSGLRKVSDWTLWRGRPNPNETRACTRSMSNGYRSIDHSRNFCPHRSKKLDGDTPGPTGTPRGNRLGRTALRREKWEHLESNNCQIRALRRKVRPTTDVTSTALGRDEMAVRL
jgi:hypothetical protein